VYLNLSSKIITPEKDALIRLILRQNTLKMSKNIEASTFRYSLSLLMPVMLTMRLKLYAININPTPALARSIPFLVRI